VEEFNLRFHHGRVYLFIIIGRLFKVIENEFAMTLEWIDATEDILIDLWRQLPYLCDKPNLSIPLFSLLSPSAGADITGAWADAAAG